MKLYFGNMVTTVTTIMIIALVGFIGYSVWNRNTISYWGCRNLFLLMYGLFTVIFSFTILSFGVSFLSVVSVLFVFVFPLPLVPVLEPPLSPVPPFSLFGSFISPTCFTAAWVIRFILFRHNTVKT